MRAAVLYGARDVRVEERALPELLPGEVRVRIGAALTCGTDVKVFRRGYHARMIQPPALFGHEFAGVIEAVGPDVVGWKVGDRVVAANSTPCDNCFFCRRDAPELCEGLLFLNGAYAEAITIPARIVSRNMYALADDLPFADAALTEPLACVVHGLEETPVCSGDTVAILGSGPIGLLFARLCHLAGARVLIAGRGQARLKLAAELGADEVIDLSDTPDIVTTMRAYTDGGRGADVVIEAVGRPEAWEQAIGIARKGGAVSLFGGCPAETSISIATNRIHYDAITIRGTFHHTPAAFRTALDLIATGNVPARAFLGRECSLDEIPAVLEGLLGGTIEDVKLVCRPAQRG